MLTNVLLFIVGLVLLIKGGDWFVDGATCVARRFHLPDIIVGATVVSVGTTLPEVMVSAIGALQGQGAMAYGNSIGSIICNTALIAAISVAWKPGPVNTKTVKIPVIFFFVSSLIYCFSSYVLGEFPRWIGFILLAIFVLYMIINVRNGLKNPEESHGEEKDGKTRELWLELVFLVAGAAIIAVGAKLLVDNGTAIAYDKEIPETVISLTFVALGTSLPELITTITSLRKGHASLGIGNVIGANIFNLVLVSGISVTLAPFEVPVGKLISGYNASLVLDIPLMIVVMLLLTVPALLKKKMSRWQGIVLMSIYAAFCIFQFVI